MLSVIMCRRLVNVLALVQCFMVFSCLRRTNKRIYEPYGPKMCGELTQDTNYKFEFMAKDLSCRQIHTNASFSGETRSSGNRPIISKGSLTSSSSCFLIGSDNCSTFFQDVTTTILSQPTTASCGRDSATVQTNYSGVLHQACKKGNLCVVQHILTKRLSEIDCPGDSEQTPVMTAARYRQERVFNFLVSQGCELSTVDTNNDTLLHVAVMGGDDCIVRKLVVSYNFDIESKGRYGMTPLLHAAFFGHHRIFEFLICRGSNMTVRANSEFQYNVLHVACMGGHVDIVQHILSKNTIGIETGDRFGATPLMYAAKRGHVELVAFMLRKGCKPTSLDTLKQNILHHACIGGSVDMVEYILRRDIIETESREESGNTPVLLAALYGHRAVFDLLKNAGCNLKVRNKVRDNILHKASWAGHVDMVSYILSLHVVDIDSKGWKDNTPVLFAAWQGHKDVVELLVNEGCNLTAVVKHGNMLHEASIAGNVDTVRYILSLHVIDIDSKGYKDMTPVMLAALKGHKDVVEILVNEGCNPAAADEYGNNVLHIACYRGDMSLVRYLVSMKYVSLLRRRNNRGKTPLNVPKCKAITQLSFS